MRRPAHTPLWGSLAIAALSAAGGAWLWHITPNGLGLDGDSASYIEMARHALAGLRRELSTASPTAGPFGSSQWPPAYPMVLAAGAWLTAMPLLTLARALHCILFAWLVWECANAARRHTRSSVIGLVAAAYLAGSPAVQLTFAMLLSEALFVPLIVIFRLRREAFSWAKDRRSTAVWLCGAALILGPATLVRWSGLFVIAGVAVAFAVGAASRRRPWQLAGAVTFAAMAVLPAAAWNIGAAEGTARVLGVHPPGLRELQHTLEAWGEWIMPLSTVEVQRAAGIAVIALLAWTAARHLKRPRRADRAGGLWAVLLVSYALLLVAARTFADAAIPMGARVWLPALPFAVLLAADAARRTWRRSWGRVLVTTGAGLLIILNVITAARQSSGIRAGVGYASAEWRESPTLRHVAALPVDAPILTNAADAVTLLLDRPATLLPMTRFPTADRPNTRWWRQLLDAGIAVRAGGGVVVLFDHVQRDDYLVTEAQVHEYLRVEELARYPDGAVYRVIGVR